MQTYKEIQISAEYMKTKEIQVLDHHKERNATT